MPIYEFQCKNKLCNNLEESLESINTHFIQCSKCTTKAVRIISATPGKVIGGASPNCALTRSNLNKSINKDTVTSENGITKYRYKSDNSYKDQKVKCDPRINPFAVQDDF